MIKPGYKTTEFYIAIATQVIAILVLAGVIKPTEQHTITETVTQAITAVGTLAASAHVAASYIRGRTWVKAYDKE